MTHSLIKISDSLVDRDLRPGKSTNSGVKAIFSGAAHQYTNQTHAILPHVHGRDGCDAFEMTWNFWNGRISFM